ncbi:hypothetical protein [Armatimonas sp.]|uniref:hypothetical protein n=1 Tax=Armatimonas sp. TaxID=1872638 RepID=UPI00374CFFCC
MHKQRVAPDALEIFTAFLDLVLGIFFMFTFVQTSPAWDDRFLLLVVATAALAFLVGCVATFLSARRVAGSAHGIAALGLAGLSLFIGHSLLTGRGSFNTIPWTGIMIVAGLLGFALLFGWFAWRALKSH